MPLSTTLNLMYYDYMSQSFSQSSDDEITNSFSSDDFSESDDAPHKNPIPFWFAHEDTTHLQKICQNYSQFLHVDATTRNTKSDARELPTFVGQISRSSFLPGEQEENSFLTLDEVSIHRRDVRLCGSPLTLVKEITLLTHWDPEEGLPTQHQIIKTEKEKLQLSFLCSRNLSVVHCLPVWMSKTEFKYFADETPRTIGYCDEPLNFTLYLPKELVETDIEVEDVNCQGCSKFDRLLKSFPCYSQQGLSI